MTSIRTDMTDYVEWMAVHNYARTTITSRQYYLDYLAGYLEALGVDHSSQVTTEVLVGYQRQLHHHRQADGSTLSVATQLQRLIPMTQLFTWLRRQGRIADNPAADLTMPRAERPLPEATLSVDEMAAVVALPAITHPRGLRDRAVLEMFYSTAIRRAELCALTIKDVDFARGTVFVRSGKGAKDRYTPIGERALFWVRLYLDLSRPSLTGAISTETLFVTANATPLGVDWLSRRIHTYIHQAGITKTGSCHLIRHSVATMMLEGGADIRYVAEMLGHARLETTQRYTRVSIDHLRHIHQHTHPAAGLNVAMAHEISQLLPQLTPRRP
jgi:integrase/recombinase XerD